jgi:hypothetical protein
VPEYYIVFYYASPQVEVAISCAVPPSVSSSIVTEYFAAVKDCQFIYVYLNFTSRHSGIFIAPFLTLPPAPQTPAELPRFAGSLWSPCENNCVIRSGPEINKCHSAKSLDFCTHPLKVTIVPADFRFSSPQVCVLYIYLILSLGKNR